MRRVRVRCARSTSWRTPSSALRSAIATTRRLSPRSATRSSTAAPAPLAEEAGDQVGVGDLGVHADERRDADLRVVVVEQEAREQLVLALAVGVLEVVRAALLDAPAAHGEQLHVGDVALDGERDGVVGARARRPRPGAR